MTELPRQGNGDAQERVAYCTRWLVEHANAPLAERVAHATVVACAGEPDGECTFADIALYLGVSATEVMQSLLSLRERAEAAYPDA